MNGTELAGSVARRSKFVEYLQGLPLDDVDLIGFRASVECSSTGLLGGMYGQTVRRRPIKKRFAEIIMQALDPNVVLLAHVFSEFLS